MACCVIGAAIMGLLFRRRARRAGTPPPVATWTVESADGDVVGSTNP